MSTTRRNLLATAGAGALTLAAGRAWAQKAEFSYKYANNLPVTHPLNLRAKEMADAIRADTKGRVDIQIFPNNQLGGDTDMLSQVRSGALDFFTPSALVIAKGKQAIEKELYAKIPPLLEQGGYIPFLDHSIPPDISYRNFTDYMELKLKLMGR